MKLTKGQTKAFFKLIKDESRDTYSECIDMLHQYPELANAIVNGMAKGIDRYSSLMLAIRFYKFKFALALIEAGADVNYIDDSTERTTHQPVFFDLLEMLRNAIEVHDVICIEEGLDVWQMMAAHGLDYGKKSKVNDNVNRVENCLEACIRFMWRYGNKHKVHHETKYDPHGAYISNYRLSEDSRDVMQEKWYELIMEKLVGCVNEDLVLEIDANKLRHSGTVFEIMPEQVVIIDCFSLDIASKYVYQRFGRVFKNINDDFFAVQLKSIARKIVY